MLLMVMAVTLSPWGAAESLSLHLASPSELLEQGESTETQEPLPVVEDLQLPRLYGSYYEIGTYLIDLEKGCSNAMLTFGPRQPANTAALTLECDRGFFHPQISGEAVPIDEHVLARTIATFHVPLSKDYVQEFDIAMVADDYSWVVIGHPKRQLLWIFSRNPELSTAALKVIFDVLESDFGYTDVRERLVCSKQDKGRIGSCKNALKHSLLDDLHRLFGH